MGRFFTRSEHDTLFLAADGRCERCGIELPPSWHADHFLAHSRGGITDLVNGQALCPPCNLAKGAKVNLSLRAWQQDALDDYVAAASPDFMINAVPGAGKTRAAAAIAHHLLDQGTVSLVVVVVPTDALRLQWADDCKLLRLRPYTDGLIVKDGYDGIVVTYQQLAGTTAALIRHATGRKDTLGIFDEIHHAGDSKAWSDGLRYAFENAKRRLSLTGTPWRSDNNRIPFVRYDTDGVVDPTPGASYGMGRAVLDGVCRPVVFDAYNGEARWAALGHIEEARLGEDLSPELVGRTLDTLYDPNQTWIRALLTKADDLLVAVREEVPDAGGLVVADNCKKAEAYASILHEITGDRPTLVISEGPENADAKIRLDAFRKGRSPWLVAVRMVSEGIDIPRLSVGVYAAKTTTPLFFRQVVGRFIRTRDGESHNAQLFIPAVPVLMRHALEVETELRHALDEEQERVERMQAADSLRIFDVPVPLSTSEPVFERTIHQGEGYEELDITQARATCQQYGIPSTFAVNMARFMRDAEPIAAVSQAGGVATMAETEPLHRLEKRKRQQVQGLASRVDRMHDVPYGTTNKELLRQGWPPRDECSVEILDQIALELTRWLGE